VDLVQV